MRIKLYLYVMEYCRDICKILKTCYNHSVEYKSFLNENRVKKLVSQKSKGVFGSFFV